MKPERPKDREEVLGPHKRAGRVGSGDPLHVEEPPFALLRAGGHGWNRSRNSGEPYSAGVGVHVLRAGRTVGQLLLNLDGEHRTRSVRADVHVRHAHSRTISAIVVSPLFKQGNQLSRTSPGTDPSHTSASTLHALLLFVLMPFKGIFRPGSPRLSFPLRVPVALRAPLIE
jgi:hypothetical protein